MANIRVSQSPAEFLMQGSNMRISQVVGELLMTTGNGNIRSSQVVGEILAHQAVVRMSQCSMEVLVSTQNQIPGNVAVFVMA